MTLDDVCTPQQDSEDEEKAGRKQTVRMLIGKRLADVSLAELMVVKMATAVNFIDMGGQSGDTDEFY